MEGLAVAIIIGSVVVYVGWFIVVCFLISILTKNTRSTMAGIIPLFVLALLLGIWRLGFFAYVSLPGPTSLSYYLPPYIYDVITQFMLPGLFSFLGLTWIVRRNGHKHALLFLSAVFILTLPWVKLYEILSPNPSYSESKQVSRLEAAKIKESITNKVISEEVLFVPEYSSKTLRIKTSINVPQSSNYRFTLSTAKGIHLLLPKDQLVKDYGMVNVPGFELKSSVYDYVYINGNLFGHDNSVFLSSGENLVVFDFPILVGETDMDRNNQMVRSNKINLFFSDGVDGKFGSYVFKPIIGWQITPQGNVYLQYVAEGYTTREYNLSDFD